MKDKGFFPSRGSDTLNVQWEGNLSKDAVKKIKKNNPGKTIKINGKKY